MSFLMENVNGVVGSTYQDLQQATSQRDLNQQIATLVTSRCKKSEQYSWTSRRRLPEVYDAYRGVSTGSKHPFRNNVNVPLLFSVIEADTARKARALLSGAPITFEGTPIPGGASFARKQQALYYQQDREDGGFLKNYQMLKASGLYGVGVQQRGWRYDVRDGAEFELIQSPVDGKRYRIGHVKQQTAFDGPSKRNIDLLDFFLEPGKAIIADARWAASRWWEDLESVEARFATGEFTNTSEFARLKQTGSVSQDMTNDMRQLRGVDAISGNPLQYDPYGRPIQLVDFVGWIPAALASDGIPFRRIVVANNQFVMLNEPFPWAHGRLDFVFFSYAPFFDPHYFFAPGKVEIGLALQRAANKFTNQTLDGLDLANNPWLFINEDALLDPRGLQLKAGRVVKIHGNPSEMVMPGSFPLSGLQMGVESAGILDKWMQKGTGIIDDVGQGIPTGGRETARGVLARSEAAGTRMDSEIMLAEQMWLCPDAEATMELNRQFLTDDRSAELLGDIAEVDPVTGLANPFPAGATVKISPRDIAVRMRARAIGTSARLTKAMQQQNSLLLMNSAFQAAGAGGPAMLAQFNLLGWIRWLANVYEVGPEVNELVIKDPQAYGAQLAMMIMASQKGGPEAGIAALGQQDQMNQGGPNALGGPSPGAPEGTSSGGTGQQAGSMGGGLMTQVPVGDNSTLRFLSQVP